MRAPEHAIPAPPFPRELTWVNVAPLRMDKQRGRPGAGRVLGLLPRQLAAHAALPRRLARALRRGRAARDRRAHRRLPARARHRATSSPPSSGSGSSTRSWSTSGSRSGTSTATRAGRRATSGTRQGALYSLHYGEGAYQETEREIQALLGVERPLVEPLRPEDAEDVLLPAQTADQPGAYSGPYEAGGAWAVLEGAGEVVANGRAFAVDGAGRYPLRRAPAPHGRRARARGRRRRDLPRDVLHAGGRSSRCPRSPSSRMSRGGPSSSTATAVPGQ